MPDDSKAAENYAKSQSVKELTSSQPEKDESASESLQKTDTVKNRLKRTLLGKEINEYYDEEKGEWVEELVDKEGVEPLINRQGLEDLWAIVEPVVSETAAGSNLSGKDVSQEGFQTMKAVAKAIAVKHREYEIQDPEDASIIVMAFNDACMNNLKKAQDARLLKHHEESTQRKVFRTEGDQENSSSSWNPFS
ncbi:MAG: hypothetical protein BRC29_03445 [Nanohaloarchaea archaeon SW_7_43_1]|nr:MAG: hypothetical protein BRC29_03445 [Nanohaloarchaea archaeon SW_7_43_1]